MTISRHSRFAAGLALVALSTGASARAVKSWQISGTVSGKCKVEFLCPGSTACTTIKFAAKPTAGSTDKPNDSTGDIKWSCNIVGQPVSLTFSSQNNGVLKSSSTSLPYHVGFTGVNATSFANAYLTTPKSTTGTAGAAFTAYTGTLTLTTEPGPNLQAGEYTDMISVTITPSGL
jgi:hypothetical protein